MKCSCEQISLTAFLTGKALGSEGGEGGSGAKSWRWGSRREEQDVLRGGMREPAVLAQRVRTEICAPKEIINK